MRQFNPNIFETVLNKRTASLGSVASRLGLGLSELKAELYGTDDPKSEIIQKISKELNVPDFVFYMNTPPNLEEPIVDFRSQKPEPSEMTRDTLRAVELARAVRDLSYKVRAREQTRFPRLSVDKKSDLDRYAEDIRSRLDIPLETQQNAKDDNAFYNIVRASIEEAGIYVIQATFPFKDGSGFCLNDDKYPVIVINTRSQTKGRRLFTLLHEFGHVLMGESGVSDPFIRKNKVERTCNQFAAHFLMPNSLVQRVISKKNLDKNDIYGTVRKASKRLKVSQEATAIRLEALGILREGAYRVWQRKVKEEGNPDYYSKGGGDRPPAQEIVKLARFGFRFPVVFERAIEAGEVSEVNLYRSTGLKPKYQRPLFAYRRRLSSDDIEDLVLDDE